MNLAVVIDSYHPHGGGAERSTSQIVHELATRGHRVTVIAGYCPGEPTRSNITIERYAKRGARSARWLLGYTKWARQRLSATPYDSSLSVTTTVPAALIQPRSGTVRETQLRNVAMRQPVSKQLSKRIMLGLSPKQRCLLSIERRTLSDPMVRWFVPGSRYVAQQLQHHYGIDPTQIRLVTNAAQMPSATPQQCSQWRQQIRSGFGVSDESTLFLFAAFNPRLKGIDPLLRATRQLLDQGIDLTLLLAGNIGYAQQRAAASLRIRDQIRIVSTTDQMSQLYAAADVTVHPTFYDPASKVVIESLMMGTPAISTSFNGASDLITAPGGGRSRGRVIADPADVASLAKAMTDLIDPAERQRCVAAMNGLADSLSIKRHVDQLEELMAGG